MTNILEEFGIAVDMPDGKYVFKGSLVAVVGDNLGSNAIGGFLESFNTLRVCRFLRQAEPFTKDQEELLWRKKVLGYHNPRVLVRTLLVLNGKHFALRSAQEHRSLRFKNPQITVHQSDGGRAILKYTEDASKTRQGDFVTDMCTERSPFTTATRIALNGAMSDFSESIYGSVATNQTR